MNQVFQQSPYYQTGVSHALTTLFKTAGFGSSVADWLLSKPGRLATTMGSGGGALMGAVPGIATGALTGAVTSDSGERGSGALRGAALGGLLGAAGGGIRGAMKTRQGLKPIPKSGPVRPDRAGFITSEPYETIRSPLATAEETARLPLNPQSPELTTELANALTSGRSMGLDISGIGALGGAAGGYLGRKKEEPWYTRLQHRIGL